MTGLLSYSDTPSDELEWGRVTYKACPQNADSLASPLRSPKSNR